MQNNVRNTYISPLKSISVSIVPTLCPFVVFSANFIRMTFHREKSLEFHCVNSERCSHLPLWHVYTYSDEKNIDFILHFSGPSPMQQMKQIAIRKSSLYINPLALCTKSLGIRRRGNEAAAVEATHGVSLPKYCTKIDWTIHIGAGNWFRWKHLVRRAASDKSMINK